MFTPKTRPLATPTLSLNYYAFEGNFSNSNGHVIIPLYREHCKLLMKIGIIRSHRGSRLHWRWSIGLRSWGNLWWRGARSFWGRFFVRLASGLWVGWCWNHGRLEKRTACWRLEAVGTLKVLGFGSWEEIFSRIPVFIWRESAASTWSGWCWRFGCWLGSRCCWWGRGSFKRCFRA